MYNSSIVKQQEKQMKKITLIAVLLVVTNFAQAQVLCFPQIVATPQGLVTVVVCQ